MLFTGQLDTEPGNSEVQEHSGKAVLKMDH